MLIIAGVLSLATILVLASRSVFWTGMVWAALALYAMGALNGLVLLYWFVTTHPNAVVVTFAAIVGLVAYVGLTYFVAKARGHAEAKKLGGMTPDARERFLSTKAEKESMSGWEYLFRSLARKNLS